MIKENKINSSTGNSDNKEMNLPNFYMLGAPKAGTTSLFSYLIQHPEIYDCKFKETRFFLDEKLYDRGLPFYLDKYFAGAEKFSIRGEATPAYLGNCDAVAPRMKETLGDNLPKLLIILRDPVDRAWSNYQHRKRYLVESMSFEESLADDENRRKAGKGIFFQYFSGGLYGKQISEWMKYYPKEQFAIHFYEELKKDPQQLLKDVFNFLEVDSSIEIDLSKKKNTAGEIRFKRLNKYLSSPPKIIGKKFRFLVPLHLQKEFRTRFM